MRGGSAVIAVELGDVDDPVVVGPPVVVVVDHPEVLGLAGAVHIDHVVQDGVVVVNVVVVVVDLVVVLVLVLNIQLLVLGHLTGTAGGGKHSGAKSETEKKKPNSV